MTVSVTVPGATVLFLIAVSMAMICIATARVSLIGNVAGTVIFLTASTFWWRIHGVLAMVQWSLTKVKVKVFIGGKVKGVLSRWEDKTRLHSRYKHKISKAKTQRP